VKLSIRDLIVPVLAVVVLALTLQQTMSALKASGSWRTRSRGPRLRTEDPYTRVDDLLADSAPVSGDIRNPFTYGSAHPATPAVARPVKPAAPVAVTPPPPARPLLTSIIYDADPRATVRYNGVDYAVHVNSLFAEFTVTKITANEVTLDRNGETIVLGLRSKGD